MQIENSTNSEGSGRTKIIKSIINTPQVCRHGGDYGGICARGRGGSPICSRLVPVFIHERAASQALEHPDRWSVSTPENGGKWKLGASHTVYLRPCSLTMFILMWQPQTCIKIMPAPLLKSSGFQPTQSKSQSPQRPPKAPPSPLTSDPVCFPSSPQAATLCPCRFSSTPMGLHSRPLLTPSFPLSTWAQISVPQSLSLSVQTAPSSLTLPPSALPSSALSPTARAFILLLSFHNLCLLTGM